MYKIFICTCTFIYTHTHLRIHVYVHVHVHHMCTYIRTHHMYMYTDTYGWYPLELAEGDGVLDRCPVNLLVALKERAHHRCPATREVVSVSTYNM
jgi:hypothetical protein